MRMCLEGDYTVRNPIPPSFAPCVRLEVEEMIVRPGTSPLSNTLAHTRSQDTQCTRWPSCATPLVHTAGGGGDDRAPAARAPAPCCVAAAH